MSLNRAVFISHRSSDKDYINILINFLTSLGCPQSCFLCSSLPGNDLDFNIPKEVKEGLKNSIINIVFLSKGYYESAYCLNEAGIVWFLEKVTIVIAMPEITENNMYGFLNADNKIRRLDNQDDILSIYDNICEKLCIHQEKTQIVNRKAKELIKAYNQLRNEKQEEKVLITTIDADDNFSDDEMLLLYYFSTHQKLVYNLSELQTAFLINEMNNVDIINGLNLLNEVGCGTLKGEEFKLNLIWFRKLNDIKSSEKYKNITRRHYLQRKDVFKDLYEKGYFNSKDKLFILYLVERKIKVLGAAWKVSNQVEDIKEWETEHSISECLSAHYEDCLQKFIDNSLVYPTNFTAYDNPKEYTIHKSLLLFFENIDKKMLGDLLKNRLLYLINNLGSKSNVGVR